MYGEPKKVQLVIDDLDKFSVDVYNMYPLVDSEDMANKIIADLKDELKTLYEFIECFDNKDGLYKMNSRELSHLRESFDIYKMGDLINILDLIEVKAKDIEDEPIMIFE